MSSMRSEGHKCRPLQNPPNSAQYLVGSWWTSAFYLSRDEQSSVSNHQRRLTEPVCQTSATTYESSSRFHTHLLQLRYTPSPEVIPWKSSRKYIEIDGHHVLARRCRGQLDHRALSLIYFGYGPEASTDHQRHPAFFRRIPSDTPPGRPGLLRFGIFTQSRQLGVKKVQCKGLQVG